MGFGNLFPINGMIIVLFVFILILFLVYYIVLNDYILNRKKKPHYNIDTDKYDLCLNCGSGILKIYDRCPNCGSHNIKRF